jgi:serine/threonine protein phosphatase 1
MSSRTFAIGDIHGCSLALETLLSKIEPQSSDTVVFLGDYIDRGPDSCKVVALVLELVKSCQVIPLLGNHDWMLLAAENDDSVMAFWQQHGGAETLESYGGSLRRMPAGHRAFFQHCQRFYETEEHFFIHANYEPEVSLEKQDEQVMLWKHMVQGIPTAHANGKTAIVGHTPQINGIPKDVGHIKLMDTFCYGGQWLSAVDVETGLVTQANNEGESRELQFSN